MMRQAVFHPSEAPKSCTVTRSLFVVNFKVPAVSLEPVILLADWLETAGGL